MAKNKDKYAILNDGVVIDTANSVDEARELGAYWTTTLNSPNVRIVLN